MMTTVPTNHSQWVCPVEKVQTDRLWTLISEWRTMLFVRYRQCSLFCRMNAECSRKAVLSWLMMCRLKHATCCVSCQLMKFIGSRAASFKRPLLSIDESVCVSATVMLNISETKRFREFVSKRKVPTARRLVSHRRRHLTLWCHIRDVTTFKVVAFWT